MKRLIFCMVIASLIVILGGAGISCTKAKPNISYSPSSLSFTATQGGDNPPIQAIGIWNSGGQTLNWSTSDNAAWLSLSPTNGSSSGGTSNVIVSVNIFGLTAGSYTGMLTISASEATNAHQTIPVTLTVAAPITTATPEPIPIGCNNYADIGNPSDEQFHNLVGWGASFSSSYATTDFTARYQSLRGWNSLYLCVPQAGIGYTLTTMTEEGGCDDRYEIYVNDRGPVFTHKATTHSYNIPITYTVRIDASYMTSKVLKVTFRNIATDNCGLAAAYFVKLE
jgi:hypothetical protein